MKIAVITEIVDILTTEVNCIIRIAKSYETRIKQGVQLYRFGDVLIFKETPFRIILVSFPDIINYTGRSI
jgi:hypothetical protein